MLLVCKSALRGSTVTAAAAVGLELFPVPEP